MVTPVPITQHRCRLTTFVLMSWQYPLPGRSLLSCYIRNGRGRRAGGLKSNPNEKCQRNRIFAAIHTKPTTFPHQTNPFRSQAVVLRKLKNFAAWWGKRFPFACPVTAFSVTSVNSVLFRFWSFWVFSVSPCLCGAVFRSQAIPAGLAGGPAANPAQRIGFVCPLRPKAGFALSPKSRVAANRTQMENAKQTEFSPQLIQIECLPPTKRTHS
jgi:hypothetical protein